MTISTDQTGEKPAPARSDTNSGLFWSWNLIFLVFMTFGFGPVLLPELIRSLREGFIPFIYLIYLIVLLLIPVVSTVLGATVFWKQARKQFAFGYVVEGPLMILLLFLFFAVRQPNPAVIILGLAFLLGMGVFTWRLLDDSPAKPAPGYLRLGGLTLMMGVAVYAGLVVLFYAIPGVVLFFRAVGGILRDIAYGFRNMDGQPFGWIGFTLLGSLLFLYSATLFAGIPVVMPLQAAIAWRKDYRQQIHTRGLYRALAAAAVPLSVVLILMTAAMQQPQGKAYAMLKNPPTSVEKAEQLVQHSNQFRAGLVNAYLASYRYFSAFGEVSHIRYLWSDAFYMEELPAYHVQRAFEAVVSPMLYQPLMPVDPYMPVDNKVFPHDQEEAARLYKQFFDASITDGERDAMILAARSTFNGDQAELAWQAVDDREILLLQQEITLTEHGDWADVQLHEVYVNQTDSRQEVVYYFSLPESAVVTGLYLNSSADLTSAFPYRIAPRGAAQQAYKNEVRINVDPALIEQIGPTQYRLRVFPILPRTPTLRVEDKREDFVQGPQMHLWLMYRTLSANGSWPLPRLAEKRNVYWDRHTTRVINSQPSPAAQDEWLPASLPASTPPSLTARLVTFPDGQSVVLRPAPQAATSLPAGTRLAIVLDRSRSMANRSSEVVGALAALNQAAGENTDVYLTASTYRGEGPSRVALARLDPEKILYLGGQNAGELLAQFNTLQQNTKYDAIVVLTDGTGYELGERSVQVSAPDAPVWVVHLGGRFPLGYDDATLDAIRASGGGVAGSVDEALARASAALTGSSDVYDGYVWQTLQPGESLPAGLQPASPGDGLAAIAARRLILAEANRSHGKQPELDLLDRLHGIAREYGIVTPYSSMIVLVDSRQQKMLDELEKQSDRFEREVEQIGETVPINGMMAGVPEPEEWLLMALAAALLAYFYYTQKRKQALQP